MTTAVQPLIGSYTADPDHSSFQAQLRHMGVGSFRTGFEDVEARLENGRDGPRLTGRARVESSVRAQGLAQLGLGPDRADS